MSRPTFEQLAKQISPGQYGTAALLSNMVPDQTDIYLLPDPGAGTLRDLGDMANREFSVTDQHGTVHKDKVLTYAYDPTEKMARVKFSDYLP